MLQYLSNNLRGRPTSEVYDFKRADTAERRRLLQRSRAPGPLLIWLLHDCDTARHEGSPQAVISSAELGLEFAKKIADPDLVSWASSGLGGLYRIMREFEQAKRYLDEAIRLAVHPYQQADARIRRGLLPLTMDNDSETALGYMADALAIHNTMPRINSDRGHTAILELSALAHLYHAILHDETHLSIAKDLYLEVLDIGCTLHARRSRRAALHNLVFIAQQFEGESRNTAIVTNLKNEVKRVKQASRIGSQIHWLLVRAEIEERGYNHGRRRRLLTILKHLIDGQAWDHAAILIMEIAALDVRSGIKGTALPLLKENVAIFSKAGLGQLAAKIIEVKILSDQEIIGLESYIREGWRRANRHPQTSVTGKQNSLR